MVYIIQRSKIFNLKHYGSYFKYFFTHSNICIDKVIKRISVYNNWFDNNLLDYFFFNFNKIVYNKISNFKNFFFYLIAFFFNYSFFNKLKIRNDRYFNFYKKKKKLNSKLAKHRIVFSYIKKQESTFYTRLPLLKHDTKQNVFFYLIKKKIILNLVLWDY